VQRLCKYPLFMRELLAAVPPGCAARAALEAAAAAIDGAASDVNERVRAAEARRAR